MKKLLLAAAVATFGFAAAPAAMAQATPPNGTGQVASNCNSTAVAGDSCDDQDMNVHAGIYGACQYIEVGDLEFGNHRTVTANATYTATTQVDVACNAGQNYAVSLDYGVNNTGTQRAVIDGANHKMNYNLTTQAGAAFGDGTGGTSVVTGTGTGNNQSIPVNGTLTQTSASVSGDYTDLVTATLTLQ